MKQKGLSASQASVVVAMRSGFKLRYMAGLNSYCWLNNPGYQRVTASALALERAGYIERVSNDGSNTEFRFTEKGNALP